MQDEAKKILWACCSPHPPIPFNLGSVKKITIGRHKSCKLHLLHNSVSRTHATIKTEGSNLIIEDLKSSNGTLVNGKRVTAHQLKRGDTVQIGPFEIEIRNEPFNSDLSNYGQTNTEFLTTNKTSAMAGQIEKTPLVEILQSIEFNEKTGTLYVEGKNQSGFFVFAAGKPVSAFFGEETNIPAVLSMLGLTKGTFILSDSAEPIDMGINCTITNILFEFSRHQDEALRQSDETLKIHNAKTN